VDGGTHQLQIYGNWVVISRQTTLMSTTDDFMSRSSMYILWLDIWIVEIGYY